MKENSKKMYKSLKYKNKTNLYDLWINDKNIDH